MRGWSTVDGVSVPQFQPWLPCYILFPTRQPPPSPVFCMFFGIYVARQVWLYSIQSEIFSLNNMLCAWTLYFAVRCVSSTDLAPLRFGALFVGLCSCNQHTSIFLFFPTVVWIYINRFKDVNSNIISMILCGVAGLLPYLYIPYQVIHVLVMCACHFQ